MQKKWNIGDLVKDFKGNRGIIAICYANGDIVATKNDATHPDPLELICQSIADADDLTPGDTLRALGKM